jgi:ribosomal protein L37E
VEHLIAAIRVGLRFFNPGVFVCQNCGNRQQLQFDPATTRGAAVNCRRCGSKSWVRVG